MAPAPARLAPASAPPPSAASQASSAASSSAAAASQQATAVVSGVVAALESALPPEFADLVALAARDSDVALALAAALAATPLALGALVASLRGYAGDVNAFVLDEALAKDKRAFLVDTRDEAQRVSDGVPDLRGAARARARLCRWSLSICPSGTERRNPRARSSSNSPRRRWRC